MQQIYININKSKPSCLIAHTLDPKFLEKNCFMCFFLEGIKKKTPGRLPGFFEKNLPKSLPSQPWPGSWLTKEPQKLPELRGFLQDVFCYQKGHLACHPKFGKKRMCLSEIPQRLLRFGALLPPSSPCKSDVPFLQTKIHRRLDGSPHTTHTLPGADASTKIQSLTQTQEHPWFGC